MLKRSLFLRCPEHRVEGVSTPSKRTGSFVSIQPPARVAGTGVSRGRTVVSLLTAGLVFVAGVVVQLAALALVPASADAAPTAATAYVTNYGSSTVTPIDVATNHPGTPIPVGNRPTGIAITPNGATAYVTNQGENAVTPIDVATNRPGTPIPVGNGPTGIAITPNGKTAYVTNQSGISVTPIELGTNTPGAPIPVITDPYGSRSPPTVQRPMSSSAATR